MIDNSNYFSVENQVEFMSVSQFKSFEKCQEATLAEIDGEWETEKTIPLLVGSYVDSYFEGTLEKFKSENPQLFKKDGELKSNYVRADTIIERIERDPLFMDYLSGEKQVIFTGAVEDVPVKIKIDSYLPDKIVDLKVVRNFEPIYKPGKGRLSWIEAWEYDLQGAVYQEIVYQNTGKRLPFYIAAATKEPVTRIAIIEITQGYLDAALDNFKKHIQFFDGLKKGYFEPTRCGKCDYCAETVKLTEPIKLEDLEYDE